MVALFDLVLTSESYRKRPEVIKKYVSSDWFMSGFRTVNIRIVPSVRVSSDRVGVCGFPIGSNLEVTRFQCLGSLWVQEVKIR